ncbi:biopolymer transporter ExbB [Capsulimonas corticalis]|uniref:Biopolymer transporter ExbB n=1 Tax=Capsulimonas corticalis TaxID=2219043 RepID=A0A402CR35_9BACT|nr:MotA/TolQ/ExbB proton channel family protein [Capsulimonas corticalis]BDI34495.1 biopolymer transporter ExbB [Capsulimonas corticalis]
MNSFMTYMHQGGVMMYPLILCAIVAIGIILERMITFRKASSVDPEVLLDDVREATQSGDYAAAIRHMETFKTPLARIMASGLRNADRSAEAMEIAMAHEAANELPALENYLLGLKTIITIAPLLGLLGTIAGMISSFKQVAAGGLSSPTAVMSGVSESLISTATGIVVATAAVIFYNYFSNLIKRFVEDLEYYGDELTNLVTGRVVHS